jgi:hypothetical protein
MEEIICQENYMKGNGIFEPGEKLRRLPVTFARLTSIPARAVRPEA